VIAARGRVLAERFPGQLPCDRNPADHLAPRRRDPARDPATPFVLSSASSSTRRASASFSRLRTNRTRHRCCGCGGRRRAAGDVRASPRGRPGLGSGLPERPGQLAGLYARASAVLLPTRGEWEGVPRVLTEAEAFGAPIWATPLPTTVGEFRDRIRYFRSARPSPAEIAQVLRSVAPFHGLRQGKLEGGGAAALQHLAALRDRDLSPPGVSPGLSTPEGRP
jgi:glycosyltransferase involved in cell wall biosynthesis